MIGQVLNCSDIVLYWPCFPFYQKSKYLIEFYFKFSPYIQTRSVGRTLAYGPSYGQGTEAIIAGWREVKIYQDWQSTV